MGERNWDSRHKGLLGVTMSPCQSLVRDPVVLRGASAHRDRLVRPSFCIYADHHSGNWEQLGPGGVRQQGLLPNHINLWHEKARSIKVQKWRELTNDSTHRWLHYPALGLGEQRPIFYIETELSHCLWSSCTHSVAPELILVVTLPTLVLVATAADHLVPDYQSNHCYYRLPLSTIPGISTLSTSDHISCIAPIAVIVTIWPVPVSFPRVPVIE